MPQAVVVMAVRTRALLSLPGKGALSVLRGALLHLTDKWRRAARERRPPRLMPAVVPFLFRVGGAILATYLPTRVSGLSFMTTVESRTNLGTLMEGPPLWFGGANG